MAGRRFSAELERRHALSHVNAVHGCVAGIAGRRERLARVALRRLQALA